MTTASIRHTDLRLRDAVACQLEWDPEVDASAIGVVASAGVVTLTGFIDSYAGKLAAERVVKRIRGVRAVANDITVRLAAGRTDTDMARDAAQALMLRPALGDTLQVVVHNGHVTLTGTVEWMHEKQQAEDAVRHVRGIRGVINRIAIHSKAERHDVRRRIVRALHEHADIDARQIEVIVSGDVVTLTGTVGSWMQRDAAERAAGRAPGIRRVDNEILVEPAQPRELEPADEIC